MRSVGVWISEDENRASVETYVGSGERIEFQELGSEYERNLWDGGVDAEEKRKERRRNDSACLDKAVRRHDSNV